MGLNLLLLVFSAFCNGLSSQAALTQTNGPVSLALGGSTTLSCTLQGVEFISPSHPSWYLQREGKTPQLLIFKSRERASGIPERFSGETYGNTAKLTISSIEEGDEGNYYCAVWHENQYIFGGGTSLTVLVPGKPIVPPSVNVFPPSPEELKGDKATVVCLVDGFYPGTVQVTWEADGTPISSGVETTKPTKLNDKFVASSYLSMAKNVWERYDAVTCKVMHEGQTFPKVVKRSECA